MLLLGAILPVRQAINNYTDEVVRNNLSVLLQESSKEEYVLDYEKLRFNIFTQRISLLNFRIYPADSAKLSAEFDSSLSSFYGININRVDLQLEKEWEIFLDKKLFIKQLKVTEPTVRIHQKKTSDKKIKFAQISGDIYQTVTQYLSLLKLYSFEVVDARTDYSLFQEGESQRFTFDPISFKLKNFRVKEGTRENAKLFFTDDVEFFSGKQQFTLPDSSHRISFDRFKISTINNQIEFYNLRVKPLKADSITENQLNVFVPALKLKSVDFERAYLDNEYLVKTLSIERPAIKLNINKSQKPKSEQQIDELEKWLNLIVVNSTRITKGNIAVNDNRGKSRKTYLVNGISLKIQGAKVDTSILDKLELSSLQDNYRLSVHELMHQIPEEELLISIKDIDYSSITELFKCGAVEISPNEMKQQQQLKNPTQALQMQRLLLDGITIKKLDLTSISEGRKTVLDEVTIQHPTVSLSYDTMFTKLPDSMRTRSKKLPYELDSISTKMLSILDASVLLTNSRDASISYGEITNTDVSASNISWSEVNKREPNFSELIEKTAVFSGKTRVINPFSKVTYSWSRLNVNPKAKKLLVADFNLQPENNNENRIKLGLLSLTGFEYAELVDHKRLIAKNAKLDKLDIILRKKQDKKFLNEIAIENVQAMGIELKRMQNDSATFEVNNATVLAKNFSLIRTDSTATKLAYEELSSSVSRLSLLAKSGKSITTTKELSFSSKDSTLEIKSLRIDPVIHTISEVQATVFQQKIESIYVKGFSPNSQNLGQKIVADNIEICNPQTFLSIYSTEDTAPKQKVEKELQQLVLDVLKTNEFAYNTLEIDNGSLSVLWKENSKSKNENRLVAEQYNLRSKNMRLNSQSKNTDNNLGFAQDYTIDMFKVQRIFPDSLNDITVERVTYSTENQNLKLHQVAGSFMVKEENRNKLFVEGTMGLVELDGIKPLAITKDKVLDLKGIYAINPKLEFTQFHNKEDVVSRELSLKERFSNDSSAIAKTILRSLKVKNGFINWDFNDTSAQPIVINNLNVNAEGLEYPNPNPKEHKPRLVELALSFGDFEYDVLKGYYNLKLDSLEYDSKKEQLRLEKARLDPNYGIFQFGQKAGWQKSRLELFTSEINLTGFKGKKLLYENNLSVSLVDIDSLWVRNFKDKRLPFKQRYVPLPQERLDSLKMGLNIKRIVLRKGEVSHIQIAENGAVPGKIYFTDLSARASNITNDHKSQKAAELTRLNALGKLMGDGQLSASFEFNNYEPNGLFEGHASMGEFDARTLNNYLTHTAFVGVKSGNVISAGIDFKAYNDFGTGDMRLLYNDLHVTFLNKEDTIKKGFGMVMKGFIANRVVNTKNPRWFRTKKGLIYTERDTSKEIFHYWSKLAMSGVASSTGVKNNKKEIKKVKKELLRREKAILCDEEKFLKKEKPSQPYGGNDK